MCGVAVLCTVAVLADQLSHLYGEMQYLEDQVTSDAVVFRIIDCSIQPLIYTTAANSEHSTLTVSDLLDSCPSQYTGDVESRPTAKKSVSLENSQVYERSFKTVVSFTFLSIC